MNRKDRRKKQSFKKKEGWRNIKLNKEQEEIAKSFLQKMQKLKKETGKDNVVISQVYDPETGEMIEIDNRETKKGCTEAFDEYNLHLVNHSKKDIVETYIVGIGKNNLIGITNVDLNEKDLKEFKRQLKYYTTFDVRVPAGKPINTNFAEKIEEYEKVMDKQ